VRRRRPHARAAEHEDEKLAEEREDCEQLVEAEGALDEAEEAELAVAREAVRDALRAAEAEAGERGGGREGEEWQLERVALEDGEVGEGGGGVEERLQQVDADVARVQRERLDRPVGRLEC